MRSQVKNHESALEEERRHSEAHKRRWEEAEVEVKDLQNRLHLQTTVWPNLIIFSHVLFLLHFTRN